MIKVSACCSALFVATLTGMIFTVQAAGCERTDCGPGSCTSYYGTEICNCTDTGYTGMFCEIPIGTCTNNSCENGGICVPVDGGGMFCVCATGFSGARCQNTNNSAFCPTVHEGDKIFLPTCPLKKSLRLFSECINDNVPYLNNDTTPIVETCSRNVWSTVQCIYRSVTDCSRLQCLSVYQYGGEAIYESIAKELYNPESPFMTVIYDLLCTLPGDDGFPNLNKTGIGSPVCTSDTVDKLIAAFRAFGNRAISTEDEICGQLDNLRMDMYKIANYSCDWNKIPEALSKFNISGVPKNYWTDVFRIAHQEFLNWRIHQCKGQGSAVCATPGEYDVELFPKCTLRKTVNQTMQCLSGLSYKLFGQTTPYECSMAFHNAVKCLGHMVGNCSNAVCEKSIYALPGASETVQIIFNTLPTLSGAFCRADGAEMIMEYIRNAFHGLDSSVNTVIEMICPGQSLHNVTMGIEQVIDMITRSSSLRETCSIVDTARQHAHHTLTTSCNLRMLENIGKITNKTEIISYVAKGINIVISMLHNYTLPMCRGIDGGTDDAFCPRITYSSSRLEVLDAYKCSLFMYRKTVSHWIELMMQWGRGRAAFMNRNWNEFASMLGFRRGYGMVTGDSGFLDMIRANMECGQTSSVECNRGYQFSDVLNCLHCYRPGVAGGDGMSMFMEWTRIYRQSLFLNKVYVTLLAEMRESGGGGGGGSTMPPFTDFSTWSSTVSYPSGSSTWSPPTWPGSSSTTSYLSDSSTWSPPTRPGSSSTPTRPGSSRPKMP